MRNEEVLHNGKGRTKANILHTIKQRKTNWICQILNRNCLLEYVIEERKKRKKKKKMPTATGRPQGNEKIF
jgi:hypothetical protein